MTSLFGWAQTQMGHAIFRDVVKLYETVLMERVEVLSMQVPIQSTWYKKAIWEDHDWKHLDSL